MTGSIAGEAAAFRARRAAVRNGARAEPRRSRVRKVYRITPDGEALFEQLLASEPPGGDDRRAFNLKLAFCRYLAPDARLGLLERRRAHLVEQLARSQSTGRTRRERMDAYMQSVFEHDTEATERDISWLEALIATKKQRAGGASPQAATPSAP
jgi:DNA-binding PadR family transcriptional regulator